MSIIKILFLGDIVGPAASEAISEQLFSIRASLGADMVIANGENASRGNGLDRDTASALLFAGVDVITSGNHIWKKKDIYDLLDDSDSVLRPANYPAAAPGVGYTVKEIGGVRVLVINAQGVVYMDALDCPFEAVERILAREAGAYDIAVLDFHAEATSEKLAMGYDLDGRVSVVVGTHTHVPTADIQILPRGTGYITDLGMTGPRDSVLGVRKEIIIEKFKTKLPKRFEIAETSLVLMGALFTVDTDGGRVLHAEQIIRDL